MVLSGLLKRVLDRFLNDFVHGEYDVGVSLFGRHSVELEHLELKCDAINELAFGENFPLRLCCLGIGKATLDVPFARLGSRPVKLVVEDVTAVARLTLEAEWDEAAATAAFEAALRAAVEALVEQVHPAESESLLSEGQNKGLGYFSSAGVLNRVLTRIIDNIEVRVERVLVRLEAPALIRPYRLGERRYGREDLFHGGADQQRGGDARADVLTLSFSSLEAITTDEHWRHHFDDDCDFIVFKVARLRGLRVSCESDAAAFAHKRAAHQGASEHGSVALFAVLGQLTSADDGVAPEPLLGPVHVELRAKLNTANTTGPLDPHRLNAQIKFGMVAIGLGGVELVHLSTLASHFGRHATWLERVKARMALRKRRKLLELESSTKRSAREAYAQLCARRARLLVRAAKTQEGKTQLDALRAQPDLLELERLLPLAELEAAIRAAADSAYGTKRFRLRRLQSSSSSSLGAGDSLPPPPPLVTSQARAHAVVVASGASSRSNQSETAPGSPAQPRRAQHGHESKQASTETDSATWREAARELEVAFGATPDQAGSGAAMISGDLAADEFEVQFPHGELGLLLDEGFAEGTVVVISCIPGSQADRTRLIESGMVITAVNGESMHGKTSEQVMRDLEAAPRPTVIRFQGTERAALAAATVLRGTLVNEVRLLIAVDCVDLTVFGHSRGSGQAILTTRMVGLAAEADIHSAGAAIGFFERLSNLRGVRACLGVAFFDTIHYCAETEVPHVLTSVPVLTPDGLPASRPASPTTGAEAAEPSNSFDPDFVPFHGIASDSVASLLANADWMYHAFATSCLLWDRRPSHDEAAPKRVPRSGLLAALASLPAWLQWSRAASGVEPGPSLLTTARVTRQHRVRVIDFGKRQAAALRRPFIHLTLGVTLPDHFQTLEPNRRRRSRGSWLEDTGRYTTVAVSGDIRALEARCAVGVMARLLELGATLDRWTSPAAGHPTTASCATPAPETSSVAQWTRYKLAVNLEPLLVVLPKHVTKLEPSCDVEKLVMVLGPTRFCNADALDQRQAAVEANHMQVLPRSALRGNNIYATVDRLAVLVLTEQVDQDRDLGSGADFAAAASARASAVAARETAAPNASALSGNADSAFFDARSTVRGHGAMSEEAFARSASSDAGSLSSGDEGFEDAASVESPPSLQDEEGPRGVPHLRQVSWHSDSGDNSLPTEHEQSPIGGFVVLFEIPLELLRLAFHAAPYAEMPAEVSIVFGGCHVELSQDRVERLLRLGRSFAGFGNLLDSKRSAAKIYLASEQASEEEQRSSINQSSSTQGAKASHERLVHFRNSLDTQGSLETLEEELWKAIYRVLGLQAPSPARADRYELRGPLALELHEAFLDVLGPVLGPALQDRVRGDWMLNKVPSEVVARVCAFFYGSLWAETKGSKRGFERGRSSASSRSSSRRRFRSTSGGSRRSLDSPPGGQQRASARRSGSLISELSFWRVEVTVRRLSSTLLSLFSVNFYTLRLSMLASSLARSSHLDLSVASLDLTNLEEAEGAEPVLFGEATAASASASSRTTGEPCLEISALWRTHAEFGSAYRAEGADGPDGLDPADLGLDEADAQASDAQGLEGPDASVGAGASLSEDAQAESMDEGDSSDLFLFDVPEALYKAQPDAVVLRRVRRVHRRLYASYEGQRFGLEICAKTASALEALEAKLQADLDRDREGLGLAPASGSVGWLGQQAPVDEMLAMGTKLRHALAKAASRQEADAPAAPSALRTSVALSAPINVSPDALRAVTRAASGSLALDFNPNVDRETLREYETVFASFFRHLQAARAARATMRHGPSGRLYPRASLEVCIRGIRLTVSELLPLTALRAQAALATVLGSVDAQSAPSPDCEPAAAEPVAQATLLTEVQLGLRMDKIAIELVTVGAEVAKVGKAEGREIGQSYSRSRKGGRRRQPRKGRPRGEASSTASRSATQISSLDARLSQDVRASMTFTLNLGYAAHQTCEVATAHLEQCLFELTYDKERMHSGRRARKAWATSSGDSGSRVSHALLHWSGWLEYSFSRVSSRRQPFARRVHGNFDVARVSLWTSDLMGLALLERNVNQLAESFAAESMIHNPSATASSDVPSASSEESPGALVEALCRLESASVAGMAAFGSVCLVDTQTTAALLMLWLTVEGERSARPGRLEAMLSDLPQVADWLNTVLKETAASTVHLLERRRSSPDAGSMSEPANGADEEESNAEQDLESEADSAGSAAWAAPERVSGSLVWGPIQDQASVQISGVSVELVKEVVRGETTLETFLPVMLFHIDSIDLRAESFSEYGSDMIVAALFNLDAQFYSRRIGSWDYIIEPWTRVKAGFVSTDGPVPKMHFDFDALTRLNINVSDDVLLLGMQLEKELSATLYQYLKPANATGVAHQPAGEESASDRGSTVCSESQATRSMLESSALRSSQHSGRRSGAKRSVGHHWLVNNTGVDVIMYDMFQIGCGFEGTLKVTYHDGWDLPSRHRWAKRPRIRYVLQPFRPTAKYTAGSLDPSGKDNISGSPGLRGGGEDDFSDDSSSGGSSSSDSDGDDATAGASHGRGGDVDVGNDDNDEAESGIDSSGLSLDERRGTRVESVASTKAAASMSARAAARLGDGEAFEIPYPGAESEQVPKLLVEVKDGTGRYLSHSINLVPHILSPGVATTEWFPLANESKSADGRAEILLSLRFEQSKNNKHTAHELKDSYGGRKTAIKPFRVASGATVALDFDQIPNEHWFRAFNRQTVDEMISERSFTTLRSVALDFSRGVDFKCGNDPLLLVVPVDNTGEFMLSKRTASDVDGPPLETGRRTIAEVQLPPYDETATNDAVGRAGWRANFAELPNAQGKAPENGTFSFNVLATSAMRDRLRRVLFLESPVMLSNRTSLAMRVLVCEKGYMDDPRLQGLFPTLRMVSLQLASVAASGNYLSSWGLGLSALFTTKEDTKWVDGGHPFAPETDFMDAQNMRGDESWAASTSLRAISPRPGGGDGVIRPAEALETDEVYGSWLQWTFQEPRAICMYRITPAANKLTEGAHALPSGGALRESVDSSRLGLDPVGWVVLAKQYSRDEEEEEEGGGEESEWVELDRREDVLFDAKRHAKQFFLPQVDSFQVYRIQFFRGALHEEVAAGVSSEGEISLAQAAVGPMGSFPIAVSSLELFEETLFAEAQEAAWSALGEQRGLDDAEHESHDVARGPRLRSWVCQLCNEANPGSERRCLLCDRRRTREKPSNPASPVDALDIAADEERAEIRRHRAQGIMRRARMSVEQARGRTSSLGAELDESNVALRGQLKVASSDLDGREHSFRSRVVTLVGARLTIGDAGAKAPRMLQGGSRDRLRAVHTLELSASARLMRWDRAANTMLLASSSSLAAAAAAAAAGEAPPLAQRKKLGGFSLERGLLLQCPDFETYRRWFDTLEAAIKQRERANQGQNVQADTFTGMRRSLDPGEDLYVPLNFLYSTKKWSLFVKPDVDTDGGQAGVQWAEVMDHISAQALKLDGTTRELFCEPIEAPQTTGPEDDLTKASARRQAFAMTCSFRQSVVKSLRAEEEDDPQGQQDGKPLPRVSVTLRPWVLLVNGLPLDVEVRFEERRSRGIGSNMDGRDSSGGVFNGENSDKSDSDSDSDSDSEGGDAGDAGEQQDPDSSFSSGLGRGPQVVASGEEVTLCQIWHRARVSFRIPALGSDWCEAHKVSDESKDGKSKAPVTFWMRGSRRTRHSEVVAEAFIERSQDPLGPLRLVLHAPLWFYNYTDVHILIRPSNSFLQKETSLDTMLEPNLQSDIRETGSEQVIPFLRDVPTRSIEVAVALPRSFLYGSQPGVSSERTASSVSALTWHGVPIQRAHSNWLLGKDGGKTLAKAPPISDFVTSSWSAPIKVKLSSGLLVWRAFSFMVNSFTLLRREIGIELATGGTNAQTRSAQVIFRCRYLLVNRLPDVHIRFEQTYKQEHDQDSVAASQGRATAQMDRAGAAVAANDADAADAALLREAPLQGDSHADGMAEGNNDSSNRAENGASDRGAENHQSDDEEEQEEKEQEVLTAFRTMDGAKPKLAHKESLLAPDKNRLHPFHFSGFRKQYLGKSSNFRITACDKSGVARTCCSAPLRVGEEKEFSVLLRSLSGSGRESVGARRVRISMRRETTTTFILFSVDATAGEVPRPFYEVRNQSSFPIEVWQAGTRRARHNLVLAPGSAIPFAWDVPNAADDIRARALRAVGNAQATARKDLVLESGGATQDTAYVPASRAESFSIDTVQQFDDIRVSLWSTGEGSAEADGDSDGDSEGGEWELPLERGGDGASERPRISVEGFIDGSTKTLVFGDPERRLLGGLSPSGNKEGVAAAAAEQARADTGYVVRLRLLLRAGATFHPSKDYAVAARLGGKSREFRVDVVREATSENFLAEVEPVTFQLNNKASVLFLLVFEKKGHSKNLVRMVPIELQDAVWQTKGGACDHSWLHVNGAEWNEIASQADREQLARRRRVETLLRNRDWTVAGGKAHVRGGEQQGTTAKLERAAVNATAASRPVLKRQETSTSGIPSSSAGSLGSSGAQVLGNSTILFEAITEENLEGCRESGGNNAESGGGEDEDNVSQQTETLEEWFPTVSLSDPNEARSSLVASLDPRRVLRGSKPAYSTAPRDADAEAWVQLQCLAPRARSAGRGGGADGDGGKEEGQAAKSVAVTTVQVFLSSVGVSVIDSFKKQEVAYIVGQRMTLGGALSGPSTRLAMTLGNFQVDNHDPRASYNLVIVPEELTPTFGEDGERLRYPKPEFFAKRRDVFRLETVMRQQQFLEIESFEVDVAPLKFNVEEIFLGNLVEMVSRAYSGDEQLVQATTVSIVHPLASNASFLGEMSGLADYVYVHWFKVATVEIVLEAKLEGGDKISAEDQLSLSLAQYVPTLAIEALRLRFRAFQRANVFEPQPEFERKVTTYIWGEVVYGNASKVLAQTSYAINPLPPLRAICTGVLEVFRQPYLKGHRGCRGACTGCQLGFTALIAGFSSGTANMVAASSQLVIQGVTKVAQASEYDIVSRPATMTCYAVRELSQAIATSSAKISEDLLSERAEASPVRLARPAAAGQDRLLLYGPGNYPMHQEQLRQLRAAAIIRRLWETHKAIMRLRQRSQLKAVNLDPTMLARLKDPPPQTSRLHRWWEATKNLFSVFRDEYRNARTNDSDGEGEGQRLLPHRQPDRR